MGIAGKPASGKVGSVTRSANFNALLTCSLRLRNFSCNHRIEQRVDFQYSGTRPLCPLPLLKLRLMLNVKIQAAAVVRPFVIGPQAAVAAMRTGVEINLVGARGIC